MTPICTSNIARKTFLSYLINIKKLSDPEVKEITGTSADTIYKHYAEADVADCKEDEGLDSS